MASISASTTTSSITAKITGLDTTWADGTRTVSWYLNGSSKGSTSLSNGVSSGGTKSFTGLSSGTTYSIKAVITWSGQTLATLTRSATTDRPAPSYTIQNVTETTVQVYLYNAVDGQKIRIYIRKDPDTGVSVVDKNYTKSGNSTFTTTIGGLTPDTDYAINVEMNNSSWIGIKYFTTDPPAVIIPDKWSWYIQNGSASAALTESALSALTGRTAVSGFSYKVWNDVVDKVVEVLNAVGDTWDSSYATYANTIMTSSNKVLTATRFNSLKFNIGSHYSTGIADVEPGDEVNANWFTMLTNDINAWIDEL